MILRIAKFLGFGFLAMLLLGCVGGGLLYLRLTQGPLEASFLTDRAALAMAKQLPGYNVQLGQAFLAIDATSKIPRVAFNNITISDRAGKVIASAPQAGLSLDWGGLAVGQIRPKNLVLIGASITARRNVDGSLALGFEENSPAANAQAPVPANVQTSGEALLQMMDGAAQGQGLGQGEGQNGGLFTLDEVRISNAKLQIYDDGNGANWIIPDVDLQFQKKDFGFLVLARGDIATAAKPWHAEISAAYKRDQRKFDVIATIKDFVPADAARKVFALSQFAALTTPMAGRVEFTLDRSGTLIAGKGELEAAAGTITLPAYFAEPIVVKSGVFNFQFQPESERFLLEKSQLNITGRSVDLNGWIAPIRDEVGKLSALGVELVTHETPGQTKVAGLIDHVSFKGQAAVTSAKLDIDDLVVMSGNKGLRVRGNISAGEKSPAIHLAGRMRDIDYQLLRNLWPPFLAPRSREWIFKNVKSGLISEGNFQVNFDADQFAEAKKLRRNPKGSVDLQVTMQNVSTHYYKSLPDLVEANGKAHLRDDAFELQFDAGKSELENGQVIALHNGSFKVADLQAPEILGAFDFDLSAPIIAMLAFASNPDLKILKASELSDLPEIKGNGQVKLHLEMPLIVDPPKDRVKVTTEVNVSDVAIPALSPGVDLTEGKFDLRFSQEKIEITGPAKINGQAAQIKWSKPRNGDEAKSQISLNLDAKSRKKLGIDLEDYIAGPIGVEAVISKNAQGNSVFDVEADLSKAEMHLAILSWKRKPIKNTKASFRLISSKQGRSVQNFKLDGPGLNLRGVIELSDKGKLRSIDMDEIRLDEDNVFSVQAVPGDGTTDLVIKGKQLDARPYIKAILAPPKRGSGASKGGVGAQDFTMRASFAKVITNRGEILRNVTAKLRSRGGRFAEMNVLGTFENGKRLEAVVVPLPEGRSLSVNSNDGGSTMRAGDFYSKISGGNLKFTAMIGNEDGSPLRNAQLSITKFQVRNDATLAEIDKRGKAQKSGPRAEAVGFDLLYLPFSADEQYIRISDGTIRGATMCATVEGVIRKADNALDVAGTVIPACGLSRAFNNVPLIGEILSGGNYNEGIFGLTYAVGGTFDKPKVQMNPLSVLAPGVFRRLFDFNLRGSAQN